MKKINHTTGTRIPFFPATEEFIAMRKELFDAFEEFGMSGQLILGQKVTKLEEQLATYTKNQFGIGCANGTDAIMLALKALGLGHEDEVIVPANSYPTMFGVALSGVKPILVDVNTQTGNIDPEYLQQKITSNTRAVIAVHLYGQPADMTQIQHICQHHSLYLVEDCAQAFGATYAGMPVGSFGIIGTFSFYPTKNLGAYGDGGAIVTNSVKLATQLKKLRTYGEISRYKSEELGYNSRLDELQAAFLLTKLKYTNEWISKRRKLAQIYLDKLEGIKGLVLPKSLPENFHTYHLFPIKTRKRDELQSWLNLQGIETGIHYPFPIHLVQTFSHLGKRGDFPIAEQWAQEELSLPIHPYLTEKQIEFVVNKIKYFFKSREETLL